ncbi:MAG: hypothetical protein U1F56_24640 [Rubrivivax sp.]
MNKIPLIAAAVLASTLAAAPAHASDLRVWSTVHIGLPIALPVPVPVPVLPRIEVVPQPVYGPPAWRDRDRDGVPDWRDPYDNRRHGHHAPAWRGDRDRDGIPDWRDRHDNRRDWAPAWRDGRR